MRYWNLDHQHQIVGDVVVAPGEAANFDQCPTGSWADHDPRAGLVDEIAFKEQRDEPEPPAESGETESEQPV